MKPLVRLLLHLSLLGLCSTATAAMSTQLSSFDTLRTDSGAPYVGLQISGDTLTTVINGQTCLLRQRHHRVYNSLEIHSSDSSRYSVVVRCSIRGIDAQTVTLDLLVQQYRKFRNWKIGSPRKVADVKLNRAALSGYYYYSSAPGRLSPRRRNLVIGLALVALLAIVGISWYQSESP